MYLQGLWGSDTAKTNRQRNIPFTSNLRLKTRTRHGMDCLRTSRYVLSGNWHTILVESTRFFFSTFWGHTISIYTLRHICQKRHPTSYVHKVDGWQQTTLRSLGLYFYQPDPDWAFPDVERYCVVCETLGNARTLDGFYLFCVKKISSFSSKCLFSFVVMYSFSFLFCLVILSELYPYPRHFPDLKTRFRFEGGRIRTTCSRWVKTHETVRPRQTWVAFFLPSKLLVFDRHFGSNEITGMIFPQVHVPWETAGFNSAGRFGWSPYWRFVDVAAAFLCGRYGTSATWCHQTYPNMCYFSWHWWGREVCEWNAWNFAWCYQFIESVYT